MVSDRMAVALALLHDDGQCGATVPQAVAAQAAAALGVDGIYAGLGTGPSGIVLAWGQQKISTELEDMQFTLGQGPGLDAVDAGVMLLVPDLLETAARWPAFVPAAVDLAVRAVFALPLRIGAISVGVLFAHRAAPGPLPDGALADALALADAITVLVAHPKPPTGTADGPTPGLARPATYRAQVHQATGMISVQLWVSLAEALVRLRARAFADDRLTAEVAADVVAHHLRFSERDL